MTRPVEIDHVAMAEAPVAAAEGTVAVFVRPGGALGPAAAAADAACGGAVSRLVASDGFKNKPGDVALLAFPAGMAAEKLVVAALGETAADARRAGGAAAARFGTGAATLYGDGTPEIAAELGYGAALRLYDFDLYKTRTDDDGDRPAALRRLRLASAAPGSVAAALAPSLAVAEGVFLTRDLVHEPANVLTPDSFAERLRGLSALGVEVEVLGEAEMAALGMRCLLAVGQGSAQESRLVVMRWNGAGTDAAPLALVGKGVTFDTGGISIKPAAGMEEMTMDMGGAGVVAGAMRAIAGRRARANVVGVVGLVENMPSDRAQRPGDIVKSMKGDTVEVINTDAEGRLVLADCLWYTQERFKPAAMIDLATLTGAVIVALGNVMAGWYASDEPLADALDGAFRAEGEQAWRLPLGPEYDRMIKSRLADIKNTGGRNAGSITAAQFLKRFVKDGVPWAHIDIAGVTLAKEGGDLAPAGATGWGVRALDRLVRDRFEI